MANMSEERTVSTVEAFDTLADLYQQKFMKLDIYDDTYNVFINKMQKENARILEIGCGPGNISRYLMTKKPNYRIFGIDLAPNMIKLARINNPSAEYMVMDAKDIGSINEKFDGIICGFCLPYLSKEETHNLIKDSHELLNPEGILYMSFIEGDYKKSNYEYSSTGQFKTFVYYHQEDMIRKVIKENNFKVIETIRKSYEKSDGTIWSHLIIMCSAK
jgi:2-polyprenyl-3-methyl-5-hydroxy-6-metoxy-1,4-benzoquinol methylase